MASSTDRINLPTHTPISDVICFLQKWETSFKFTHYLTVNAATTSSDGLLVNYSGPVFYFIFPVLIQTVLALYILTMPRFVRI